MNSKIPSYDKIVDYFFLNFKLAYDFNPEDRENIIILVTKENNFELYFNSLTELSPTMLKWGKWSFPVFIDSKKEAANKREIKFDIFVNTFLLLSGWQEWISNDKDKHGRFKYSNSLQHKYNFTTTPVINIYFELLYKAVKSKGIKIVRKEFKSPFVYTHDIDQLDSGWFEDIGYELRNFKLKSFLHIAKSFFTKIFHLKDSYYKAFEKMCEIEKAHKIKSIAFFMTKKSHQDGDYNLTKKRYQKLLNQYSKTNEIGIHPGYNTYINNEEFKNQLEILKKISPKKITKVRQHFLKYDVKKTPLIHEELNIHYDFSLGFVEMYGFRNSIATPFYLFNFSSQTNYNILEIPLFFMEGTLTHYIKGNRVDNINNVLKITKDLIIDFNIHVSLLFHNTAFSDKKYKGFTQMYKDFISIEKKLINNE